MHRTILLKPYKSSLRVECRIYDRHADMMRAIREDNARGGESGVSRNTAAFCCAFRSVVPSSRVAIVYFCKRHISIGVVAHEFSHVAFSLLARRGVKRVECTTEHAPIEEEVHATVLGDLVDGFYKLYAKL